jgi:arginyl-tRNA synthetase
LNCKFSQGESFYNPYIPPVLEELTNKGLIIESEGAQVIPIEDQKSALIVVKSNGGFNYASTDLAALWSVVKTEISKFSHFCIFPPRGHKFFVTCFCVI